MRNFIATLMISQGVPMICGGDEIGRTQLGNNNAYCQDNEITWHDWELDDRQRAFLEFTRRIVAFRRAHPVLHRRKFLQGRSVQGSEIKDITWFKPDGTEMSDEEWNAGWVRTIGFRLGGAALDDVDENGEPISDETLLILINAHHGTVPFKLPAFRDNMHWDVVLDTASPDPAGNPRREPKGSEFPLEGRSLVVFHRVP
jgi:glycogen operon protein